MFEMLIFSIPVGKATGFGASAQEMAVLEKRLHDTFAAVQSAHPTPAAPVVGSVSRVDSTAEFALPNLSETHFR